MAESGPSSTTEPPAAPPVPRTPASSIGVGVVLSLAAWLLSRIVVGARKKQSRNPFSFHPQVWFRHDSFTYLYLSEHRTTLVYCSPGSYSYDLHITWCGSAVYLPGYSWLIAVAHAVGVSASSAGVAISWLALAATLFLVWLGWARDLHPARALVLLVLFGVFPGAVYNFAMFPTSLALLFMVAGVLLITRGHFAWAALVLVCAGLCYPTEWPAGAALVIAVVVVSWPLGVAETLRRGAWTLAGLGSIIVLGITDQFQTGHFTAYFLEVDGVSPSLWGALDKSARLIFEARSIEQRPLGSLARTALSVQAGFSIALSGLAAALAFVGRRITALEAETVYPAMVGMGVVLGVLAAGNNSGWNRSIVLAAPCVVSLRKLPMPLLAAIVMLVAIVTYILSGSFFSGALV
jgi:hypothetical protein